MPLSHWPYGVSSFGIPVLGSGALPIAVGKYYFVDGTNGADGNEGTSLDFPLKTIQRAVNLAVSRDAIFIAPGAYNETVTVAFAKSELIIAGLGGRGAAFIEPSAVGAEGLEVRGNDVTLINLGVASEDTADFSLRVFGARFRAFGCKFEGNDAAGAGNGQVVIGPGTVAQIAALTHGKGADFLFEDCEICWGTNGFVNQSSDFGAVTQGLLRNCHFHNLTTVHVGENDIAAIGAVRNFEAIGCTFDLAEDGSAPTDFIDLNSVGSTGLIAHCSFASAAAPAAGVVQLAAGVLYVTNYSEAGQTVARPA